MAEQKTKIAHYELVEELGRGGFAVVYKAHDTRMERQVALKVITGGLADESIFVQRFRREVRTAAGLSHPNVVPVYDFGDADGVLYLAMALIGEGHTLRHLLAERAPLSLDQALSILTPLAAALDYLHQLDPPLTHRDVKPANVLLAGDEDSPWVVLTDFGLVRSLQASTELTRSGSILGTPAYMAPEQADAKQWGEVTPLTDVYALGVVAYEMLTGHAPFEGETPTVLHAHAYESPPSPLELLPGLGDDLSAVLLRVLNKLPAERYPSAGAFVAALQAVAETWAAAEERESTLEQLEARSRDLLAAGEWLEALDRCTQMVRLDPDRPAALEMLTAAKQGLDHQQVEAVRRRRLEERYREGLKLFDEEKWKQAIAAFEEVEAGNPDFRDVQEKLAQARDELQRARWYDEAIAHGEAGRWAEACRAWISVLRGRLDYRDGDAADHLLDATEGLLGQHKQGREALMFFDTLVAAVEQKDWDMVIGASENLLRFAPNLDYPQAWLARARDVLRRQKEPKKDQMTWEQDGKEMVRIPAGEFLYGDEKEKRELPEFWIDKTSVTNAEYARFAEATGYQTAAERKGFGRVYKDGRWQDLAGADWRRPGGPKTDIRARMNHPVVQISWEDAAAYAEWAGKRLPTEEEWEKAARGTDGREYPWGDWQEGRCNSQEAGIGTTTPVGQYAPHGDSPYGCMDMAGNVWEWTLDNHNKNNKVIRGGSWYAGQQHTRATHRSSREPDVCYSIVGFRCVASKKKEVWTYLVDVKEVVRIPAGEFLFGDEKEKRELPEFWIDKTPVTNAEYARFVRDTDHTPPKYWKGETPPAKIAGHPVVYVSWHDVTAYAEWAGKRLPTEEEWEKAARGTDGRMYPWGDEEPTPELCNFGQNEGGTTPVGKYSPQGNSPYGCVDMAGNVWEWTASDHEKGGKVLRGGSWYDDPRDVRGANRGWFNPADTGGDGGFRCARGSE